MKTHKFMSGCLAFALMFISLLPCKTSAQRYSDELLKGWENRVPIPGEECETKDNLCDENSLFEASNGYKIGSDASSITTNQGISSSGVTVANKNIEVYGTYRITLSVTFNNCTFKMHPDSRIIFENSTAAHISFYFCKFFSCDDMWEGIRVENSATSSLFVFSGCRIEDAFKALTVKESGTVAIVNTEFINNYIGITNLKQDGTPLNATIRGNTFKYTNAGQLRPLTGKMLSDIAMFILHDCGIYFVNTRSNIGSPGLTSYINLFTCMTNGIWVVNSVTLSRNNHFTLLGIYAGIGTGILAENGTLTVKDKCFFKDINYGVGIQAIGVNLTAYNNDFQGDMYFGIESSFNDNAEQIDIHRNRMNMTGPNCFIGINVDRSNNLGGTVVPSYTMVNDNFIEASIPTTNTFTFSGIFVGNDFNATTDEAQILRDTIHIKGTTPEANGITVETGFVGDNYRIEYNDIRYSNIPNTIHISHGIEITAHHPSGGVNHRVIGNRIIGKANLPAFCGIHTGQGNNIQYCQNTIDSTFNGIHFELNNDIQMRENNVNRHEKGLWVSTTDPVGFPAFIGFQTRRANEWLGPAGNYTQFTAHCENCTNVSFSRFFIETSTQPRFPFPTLISPPITGSATDWFITTSGDLDLCKQDTVKEVKERTFSESVMDGTSGLPASMQWEWERQLLLAHYFHPAAEPDELEQAFYNGLAGSTAEAYADITRRVIEACRMTPEQQQTIDGYRAVIRQKMQEWEEVSDAYASEDPTSPSQEHIDAVEALFPALTEAARNEQEWEAARDAERHAALLEIRTANEALAVEEGAEWMNARKLLHKIAISHLLGETISENDYTALLEIADANPVSVGQAKKDVLKWLYPWDAAPYKMASEHPELAERNQAGTKTGSRSLQAIPNPSYGLLTLSVPKDTRDATLQVFNMSGYMILERHVSSDSPLPLDLGKQPAGLYWFVLLDHVKGERKTIKVSITR